MPYSLAQCYILGKEHLCDKLGSGTRQVKFTCVPIFEFTIQLKVLKPKWYRQFTRPFSCSAKSSLGTRLSQVYNFHCSGAGDLRTKMKESLESESSTGTAELESSASCGGTVWEIDLSSFKTGKSSRQPYSKEAPPAKSSVFSRPLQPKQLVKVMLPPSEPSTSPAPTLMRTPQDMEQRKVLDLRRWYVHVASYPVLFSTAIVTCSTNNALFLQTYCKRR